MIQPERPQDRSSSPDAQGHGQPLHLIVGSCHVSPCDRETFARFKVWIARTLTEGTIDCYAAGSTMIVHWDDQAAAAFPHLLNPCECGTFLPIDVEPGPMLGSAMGLISDLQYLRRAAPEIPAEFCALVEALMVMADRSITTNTPLEIR